MTGAKSITPETYIRNLPFSAHRYMCLHLDTNDTWKTLVKFVPKKLDCTDSDFQERYTLMQVKMFEDKSRRSGSATQCILTDWGTQNAKVKHLLKVFVQSKLYAMADYLSVDLMHMERVPREDSPPGIDREPIGRAAISRPMEGNSCNTDSVISINKEILYRPKMDKCDVEAVQMKPSNPKGASSVLDPHQEKAEVMVSYRSGEPSAELLAYNDTSMLSTDDEKQEPKDKSISKIETLKLREDLGTVSPLNETNHAKAEVPCNKLGGFGSSSQIWPYSALRHYTNSFNAEDVSNGGNVIGSGGFGRVFLGILPNGLKVAIKQLNLKRDDDALMEKQFETELKSLSTYRHENIVLLLGYSVDGPQKCLIYEYMPNGSLEDRLCCYKGTPPLSWKLRLYIVHAPKSCKMYKRCLVCLIHGIMTTNIGIISCCMFCFYNIVTLYWFERFQTFFRLSGQINEYLTLHSTHL